MMKIEPSAEHKWLQKFVGEWTYESECPAEPGQPPMKFTGTETGRAIGDLWIMCEGRGQMPDGTPASMYLTLGFDAARKAFVGSWIGSMMTHLWTYEGRLDDGRRILTLDTVGPAMCGEGTPDTSGKTARYQDVHEFRSDDHRVLTSRMQGEDGKWHQFMECHYYRKK